MTAPVADAGATAPAVVDEAAILNDDAAIAAAISGVVERKQHLLPDEPAAPDAATPKADTDAPAPPADPAAVDAKATADSTTPEGTPDGAADPAAAPDPFAAILTTAKPLTYKVNGTERTFDGLLELPDGKGAFVTSDKVHDLRQLLSRYDSNAEAQKESWQKVQAYETRFGGMEKITERLELAAQTDAAALTILTALRENPLQFVMLDAHGQVVANPDAVRLLTREAALNAKDAKWQVRQEWEAGAQTAQRSQADAELRATAVPNYIGQAHADLHADDRAFLERRAPQYLFTASREQAAAYGVAEGTLMVDTAGLDADVAHLKTLRSQVTTTKVETTAAVKAAEKAAKENATRQPPPKPAPKAAPQPRDPKSGEFRPKRLDAAEIFERSLRGDAIGTPQLTE